MTSKVRIQAWMFVLLLSAVIITVASSCGSSSNNNYTTNPNPTPKELNSGDFGNGGTFQHRFATAGTFPYHCIHHTPMTGSVVVSDAAPSSDVTVTIVSSSAPFPAATVKPGGQVTWTNSTVMVHTVTSN
jgi:plastocyanin